MDLLAEMGFDFELPGAKKGSEEPSVRAAETWNARFQDLNDFKDAHGHCNVPVTYKTNPALAKWVSTQRIKYRKGSLSPEYIGENLHRNTDNVLCFF